MILGRDQSLVVVARRLKHFVDQYLGGLIAT